MGSNPTDEVIHLEAFLPLAPCRVTAAQAALIGKVYPGDKLGDQR